ncbi:hypothetical protein PHET_11867 [Paragonimus heterotremus]|uniref:C2H2-type domain-containing protein n=1 Tax=Paragonimus heterotremus TaxID=100268 RepID=A0A8J4WSA2_9TREM|nr:hypothetical protein PHET_11867 [Paragonimus heterotremus]
MKSSTEVIGRVFNADWPFPPRFSPLPQSSRINRSFGPTGGGGRRRNQNLQGYGVYDEDSNDRPVSIPMFMCEICGVKYRSRTGLNYHFNSQHPQTGIKIQLTAVVESALINLNSVKTNFCSTRLEDSAHCALRHSNIRRMSIMSAPIPTDCSPYGAKVNLFQHLNRLHATRLTCVAIPAGKLDSRVGR